MFRPTGCWLIENKQNAHRLSFCFAQNEEITEDKQMYDATEKARRDRQWAINATRAEGEIKGEIKLIQTLQGLLGQVPSDESQLKSQTLAELQRIAIELKAQLRSRMG
jgi:hypothetical protein